MVMGHKPEVSYRGTLTDYGSTLTPERGRLLSSSRARPRRLILGGWRSHAAPPALTPVEFVHKVQLVPPPRIGCRFLRGSRAVFSSGGAQTVNQRRLAHGIPDRPDGEG